MTTVNEVRRQALEYCPAELPREKRRANLLEHQTGFNTKPPKSIEPAATAWRREWPP